MLHRDHFMRRLMISFIRGTGPVRDQTTLEASIIAFAHRRMDTDVRRDASQQQCRSTGRPQQHFQISRMEGALAAFINYIFVR